MLKKQEYERLIDSCKQKTNVTDNEDVRDNAEVRDGSRKQTKAKGKVIEADKGKGIATEEDLTGYDTDYGNSSEYDSPSDEEDEQENDKENDKVLIRKMPKFPTYNPNSDPFKFEPELGMKFANPKELKFALTCYAVANGKNIRFPRNAHYKLEVKCVKGCPCRIWASWI
ncbi:hypothetical protein FRX31_031758 [Thalictrum thalictroides]|uniref:Transposase MuDR plant domain-containing protein n=1 Tax=Thalictrum thalictroides TaxID=46969 RepID=A0A7J6V119_THATH|nr:hypothetical protein FRX31_031758 [Thalictrum thalictroides]